MSKHLNNIKEVVLLGTDRKAFSIEQLPQIVQRKIAPRVSNEQMILDAITYLFYFDKHGKPLATTSSEVSLPPIAETNEYANVENESILKSILELEYHLKNDLLKEWINIADAHALIISADLVLELIEAGKRLRDEDRQRILNVIGNKGRYLLSIYPMPEYGFAPQAILWESGNSDERFSYFKKLRTTDANLSRELFSAAWPGMNVHEKIKYLQFINLQLIVDDLETLATIYRDEYEDVEIKQVRARTIKLQLCGMLCRLDAECLLPTLRQAFEGYVEKPSSGILSKLTGKNKWKLKLPHTADDFWNGVNLNRLFGIQEKNADKARFDLDPQYWLSIFIEYLPLDFWCELLKRSAEDLVKYFLSDPDFQTKIKGEQHAMFEKALIHQAYFSKNKILISTLSKTREIQAMDVLVPYMSQSDFEKFVSRTGAFVNLDLLATRAQSDANQWSLAFSKNMISELIRICKGGKFQPHKKFGMVLSRYFTLAAFNHLVQVSQSFVNEPWFYAWRENIVVVIQTSFRLKKQLLKLRNELNKNA